MFLSLLKSEEEKALFLRLAYLVAVGDCNKDNDKVMNMEFRASRSSGIMGIYGFSSLPDLPSEIKVFSMDEKEILILKQFAGELGYSTRECKHVLYIGEYISSPNELFFHNINTNINEFSDKALLSVLEESDMLGYLQKAFEEVERKGQTEEERRLKAIELCMTAFLASYPEHLSPEIKKIILLELTSMAFADCGYQSNEQHIISLIYEHFGIDKELQSDFETIINKVAALTKEAFNIITE
jgi:hypothetical protein